MCYFIMKNEIEKKTKKELINSGGCQIEVSFLDLMPKILLL